MKYHGIFMDSRQPAPEIADPPSRAVDVLNEIRELLPRLFDLAEAGELEGDYWFDLATCRELLAGVAEAFEENS